MENKTKHFKQQMSNFGVPEHLQNDVYWKSMLYIFLNGPFNKKILSLINFEEEAVNVKRLEEVSWSSGESFLVSLALHLFDTKNQLPSDGLNGIAGLSPYNRGVALQAIIYRFWG